MYLFNSNKYINRWAYPMHSNPCIVTTFVMGMKGIGRGKVDFEPNLLSNLTTNINNSKTETNSNLISLKL